ncbi:MAG: hypothetical protein NDJ75_04085 [Thermoanaerobaculia bacterium]|nr:hypothetical protein [Thermoanaerobaculia bacterium]
MSKVVVELVVTGLFAFVYGDDVGNGPTRLEILAPAAGAMHHEATVELLGMGETKPRSEKVRGVELSIGPEQVGIAVPVARKRKAECPLTLAEGVPTGGTDEAKDLDWTVEMSCLDDATQGRVPKAVREDRTGKIVSTRIRLPNVPISVSTAELSSSTLGGMTGPVVTRFAPFKKSQDTKSWQVTADKMLVRLEMQLEQGDELVLKGVDIQRPSEVVFERKLAIPRTGPVHLTLNNVTNVTQVCQRSTLDGICTGVSRAHFEHFYSLLAQKDVERPTIFPGVDPEGDILERSLEKLSPLLKPFYAGGGRPICMMSSFVAEN